MDKLTPEIAKGFAEQILSIRRKAEEDEEAVLMQACELAKKGRQSVPGAYNIVMTLASDMERLAEAEESLNETVADFDIMTDPEDDEGCGDPGCEACSPRKVH